MLTVKNDQATNYLRLSLVRGVGVRIGKQLVEACGSIDMLWEYSSQQLQQIEGVGPALIKALGSSKADTALHIAHQCRDAGISIICPEDAAYPETLNALEDAPLILFVKGQIQALQSAHVLSVVGARKSSREGKLIARRWSSYLANLDVCIVSGMAYGIDAAAHGGAIDVDGVTIAVLGCGLLAADARQQQQINAIAKRGCVISEFLPDVTAKPENFPRRNRIIAGVSQATLVIEADLKSGSLITAGQAAQYGRDVLSVPGSVLNKTHAGCHQLIRDGAQLVESADEVLRSLGWHTKSKKQKLNYCPNNESEGAIITALEHEILHLDALAGTCNLTVPALSPILLALELQGVIERLPGSRYTLGGEYG